MSQRSPLILAIGAAGKFAGMVVPELAKRGANVRGFVRSPDEKNTPMAAGAAAVVIGDLVEKASVRAAMKGVDRVFYIAPAFLPHEAEVGVRVVEAAKDAGVRRFAFSSVIHPTLSALGNHAEKGPVEEALLSSGMEYTFLHPTVFFQNFSSSWASVVKTGVFAEPWSADRRFSRVDYRDVAEVAAIALTEDRLLYGTFELCAEGWLNRHEIAAMMSEVLGRPIEAERVDPKTAAEGAGPGAPALEKMFNCIVCSATRSHCARFLAVSREPSAHSSGNWPPGGMLRDADPSSRLSERPRDDGEKAWTYIQCQKWRIDSDGHSAENYDQDDGERREPRENVRLQSISASQERRSLCKRELYEPMTLVSRPPTSRLVLLPPVPRSGRSAPESALPLPTPTDTAGRSKH
jgi:uncharacterized protein YbjT (DUF2867 family)